MLVHSCLRTCRNIAHQHIIILQIVAVEGYDIGLGVYSHDQDLIIESILSQKVPIEFTIEVSLFASLHLIVQSIIRLLHVVSALKGRLHLDQLRLCLILLRGLILSYYLSTQLP